MAFQIKDFASITASCINWMKTATTKVTDFNIGSVVRSMLEAIAAEIDELYQQMFIGLREAIPVSVYNSFDFSAIGAVAASGFVRVQVAASSTAALIQSGTVFKPTGSSASYAASLDTIIPAGSSYVDVLVVAVSPGTAGNLPVGAVFALTPSPDGFVSASNLSAFSNGIDAETPESRKVRFAAYIAALSRSPVAGLDYGLKTVKIVDAVGNVVERVISCAIVEPYVTDNTKPVALVQCYIHNGVGSTSSGLVTRAREVLYGYYDANGNAVPGYKAAGVQVEIYPATETLAAVTGVLTVASGFNKADLVTAARQVIYAYVLGLPIGKPAIRAKIIELVMGLDGVTNFIPSLPAADVAASASVKLMPGAISIT